MKKGLMLEKRSSTLLLKELKNEVPRGANKDHNYWVFG